MTQILPAAAPARLRVVHLVDDGNWGGVTRGMKFLGRDADLAASAQHSVVTVRRSALSAPALEADVIVSHLAISWRALPFLTALRARYAHLPMAHVEHSYCEGFVAGNVLHRLRFQTLLRSAFAMFDRICSVSAAQGEWLVARGLVGRERLQVLRSCGGVADFLDLPLAEGAPRAFGAIGRFDRQKGFDLLIEAFRRVAVPGATLTLVGDGPERGRLEALAAGDPRIGFAGYSASPATMMRRFDAVVMPSRWEAYGLVALEAMAAGRDLLVSGVDGLADHVGRGARLCRGRAAEDWAAALTDLAAQDPAQACARRLAGRAAVVGAEAEFRAGYDRLVRDLSAAPELARAV